MNDTIFDAWQKHLDVDEKKGSETQQARARLDHMPLSIYKPYRCEHCGL